MQNGLNNVKMMISVSVTKNAPVVVEENELRKDGKKSWKTMKNTLINLYFFALIFL